MRVSDTAGDATSSARRGVYYRGTALVVHGGCSCTPDDASAAVGGAVAVLGVVRSIVVAVVGRAPPTRHEIVCARRCGGGVAVVRNGLMPPPVASRSCFLVPSPLVSETRFSSSLASSLVRPTAPKHDRLARRSV